MEDPKANGKIFKFKEINALSITLEPCKIGQICKYKEMVIYSIEQDAQAFSYINKEKSLNLTYESVEYSFQ